MRRWSLVFSLGAPVGIVERVEIENQSSRSRCEVLLEAEVARGA